jgi:DNA-binding CsgD family transcriptional regulator
MLVVGFRAGLEHLEGVLGATVPVAERVVFVSGGLGAGKTTLLYEFGRLAEASGALVLSASATEDGLELGVIEQLGCSAGVPEEIAASIAELVSRHRSPQSDTESDPAFAHHLAALLIRISTRAPVVVEIDNLHFVDDASAAVIAHLRLRLGPARMVLVAAEPDWLDPAWPRFSAELARYPHTWLSLAPMTEGEIEDLISRSPDGSLTVHHAPAFQELSGGNPSLVEALLEDNRWAGDEQAVAGHAYGLAVLTCLYRAEPEVMAVARAVAILDSDAEPALAGDLAGSTPDLAAQLIAMLGRSGLLADGRFRHPAGRTAVLTGMPADQRTWSHMRAAELLHERGAVAASVARHLIAADRIAASWSQAVLMEAADHALEGGEAGFATRCLVLAHRTGIDDEQRGVITNALVRAGWRVSPSEAGHHLSALSDAAAEGTLAGRDAVTLMRYSLWNGDSDLLHKALRALAELPDAMDPRVRAELRLAWQWSYGTAPSELAPCDTDDDPWAKAVDVLATVWTHGGSAAATSAAETLLRSSRLADSSLEMVSTAILALLADNSSARADWWCQQLLETATARGATTWQALLTAIRSSVSMRRGELFKAAAQADAAFSLLDPRGWGVLIGFPLGMVVRINTTVGRHAAAAEALRHPVPEELFTTVGGLQYLHVRGQHHLANDEVLAAISDFQRCRTLAAKLDLGMSAWIPWASDLARAYLRLGDADVARALATDQLDRADPLDNRTRGLTLRVLAAASLEPERAPMLEEAVGNLVRVGDPVELAGALNELSDACGDPGHALACLRDRAGDIDLGSVLSMVGQVYQARGEFDRMRSLSRWTRENSASGAEQQPGDQWRPTASATASLALLTLSDAERRVAELAVLRHSNREIGNLLYVTISTVEQHLTRVYRKLGIDGRAQLSAELFG